MGQTAVNQTVEQVKRGNQRGARTTDMIKKIDALHEEVRQIKLELINEQKKTGQAHFESLNKKIDLNFELLTRQTHTDFKHTWLFAAVVTGVGLLMAFLK